MKFASYPELTTDIHGGGHFAWTKRCTTLHFLADGKVSCDIETFASSQRTAPTKPVQMTGQITALEAPDRLQFRVTKPGTDQGLSFTALRVQDELLCSAYSEFSDSRFSLLLRTDDALEGFSLPPPPPSAPEPEQPAPKPKRPPFRRRTIAPQMRPPVVGEAFKKQLASLNRQLKKRGGAANTLRAAYLQPHQRGFLGAVFAGPVHFLKDDALGEISEHYAAESKRLTMQDTHLKLPETPFSAWEAAIGESTWGGVIVVYDLEGFSMVGRTLVD